MFNHKEGCPFNGFYKQLTRYDPNGPDTCMEIDENGIIWDENIHTYDQIPDDKKDFEVKFNFCPCCGVENKE
jgi:hypothetical protein